MGKGIKISENERPSFSYLSKRLDDRVDKKLQRLFVIDIQNDCGCDVEVYDSGIDYSVAFLTKTGIKFSSRSILPLPMLAEISNKDIFDLLKESGNNSKGLGEFDCPPSNIIYNVESDFEFVIKTFEKFVHYPFHENIVNCVSTSFVPKGEIWLTPDSEFFGCISANIDKFGVFCKPDCIFKIGMK